MPISTDTLYEMVHRLDDLSEDVRTDLKNKVFERKQASHDAYVTFLMKEGPGLDDETWKVRIEEVQAPERSWHWIWCIVARATATLPEHILSDHWEWFVSEVEKLE